MSNEHRARLRAAEDAARAPRGYFKRGGLYVPERHRISAPPPARMSSAHWFRNHSSYGAGSVIPRSSVDPDDGWVLFENAPFDTVTPVGWGSSAGFGSVSLVSGGVEMNFPPPPPPNGGAAPWLYYKAFTRTRGLRSVQTYQVSSDYVANTVMNKVSVFWGGVNPTEQANSVQSINVNTGIGTDPLYPCFGTQATTIASPNVLVGSTLSSDPGTGGYLWNNTGTAFTRAAFHTIDSRCMGNTAGNSDGWVQVYMDSVLVIHVTGLAWKAGDYTFSLWYWEPTYGGLADVPAPGNFKERTGDNAGNGIKLYSRAA